MASEFYAMTAPYECYLAPGGQAEFVPATLTEKPACALGSIGGWRDRPGRCQGYVGSHHRRRRTGPK